jgi:hypothetical protein
VAPQAGAMHRWNATFVVAATLMAGFLVKNGLLRRPAEKEDRHFAATRKLRQIRFVAQSQSPFSASQLKESQSR